MHGNIIVGIKPNALAKFFLHVAKSLVQPLGFLVVLSPHDLRHYKFLADL